MDRVPRLGPSARLKAWELLARQAHHQNRCRARRRGQTFHNGETFGSGSIQVIEHYQHRPRPGELSQGPLYHPWRVTVLAGSPPRRAGDGPQQRLSSRTEGLRPAVVAVGVDHQGTTGMNPSGKMGGQAGLAHTGIPGQQRQLTTVRNRAVPEHLQPAQLSAPAHERAIDGRQVGR